MKKKQPKVGDLAEVKWLDIVWFLDIDDLEMEQFKNGGDTRYTVGYIAGIDRDKILISSELDEDRDPNRDFNLIPMSNVKGIEIIREGTFDNWGGVLPKKDKNDQ